MISCSKLSCRKRNVIKSQIVKECEYKIKLIKERKSGEEFFKSIFYYHFTCPRNITRINNSNISHRICFKQSERLNKKDHMMRTRIKTVSSNNRSADSPISYLMFCLVFNYRTKYYVTDQVELLDKIKRK